MPATKQIPQPKYASSDDFERIFDEEMNSLYLLSFLLTADPALAEKCFVSGLEDAKNGNPVFKEWARSWAERMIIQNAVRVISPRPSDASVESHAISADRGTLPAHPRVLDAILDLDTFARFVYAITVLERYSDQDCSVLIGCGRRDVVSARVRALQQIATIAVSPSGRNTSSEKMTLQDLTHSATGWLINPPFATSA